MAIGDVLNKVSDVANAASGYAGKIGSIVSGFSNKDTTAKHLRDIYTNGFSSPDTIYKPIKFARAFDEPTYLTFRIEFNFFDPIRNMAYNNNNIEDGAGLLYGTMYDYMPEPFLQKYGNYSDGDTSYGNIVLGRNDTGYGKSYSTEGYLRECLGDFRRAELLKSFKEGLMDIQNNYPYYFTKITGLNTLTDIQPERGMRLKDTKIDIECYEALDLRITQLMQMYRKIVWDDKYQRWVLPDMMRYFSMKIYVSEIRLFHHMRGLLDTKKNNLPDFSNGDTLNAKILPTESWYDKAIRIANDVGAAAGTLSAQYLGTDSTITKAVDTINSAAATAEQIYGSINKSFITSCVSALNNVMPTIVYDCHMCELDITSMMEHISTLNSHNSSEQTSPKISIKIGQVDETQSYPLSKGLAPTNNNYDLNGSVNMGNTISDIAFTKPNRVLGFYDEEENRTMIHRDANWEAEARINDFKNTINDITGGESFLLKKYGNIGVKTDSITELEYTKDQTTESQAIKGLVTASLGALSSYNVIKKRSQANDSKERASNYISDDYAPKEKINANYPNVVGSVQSAQILKQLAKEVYESDIIESTAVDSADKEQVSENVYMEILAEIENDKNNDEKLRAMSHTMLEELTKESVAEWTKSAKDKTRKVVENIYGSLNEA